MILLASHTKRNVFFSENLSIRFWFVILGVETQRLVWIWFRGPVLFCAAYYFEAVWAFKIAPTNIVTDILLERVVVSGQRSRWVPASHGSLDSSDMSFSTVQVYHDTHWLPQCGMFFHSVVQIYLVIVGILPYSHIMKAFPFALMTTQCLDGHCRSDGFQQQQQC